MFFQRAVQGENIIICDYNQNGKGARDSLHQNCINKQYLIIFAV
jgi:hypothetical protein